MASHTKSSKPQSAMAKLLASHQNKVVSLKKGELIKGKLTKLSPSEITVDLGAKTEAIVLEKEKHILNTILSSFKVGDTVEVNVLNPESEYGQPIVSLRRYLGDISWKQLDTLQKSKEAISATVQEVTKAGFVLTTNFGASGFLPMSQTSQGDIAVGQEINVTVLELIRKDNKVIFSQKVSLSEETFAAISKQLKVGDKVVATITNVSAFGLFVTFKLSKTDDTVEGFIHISEIAWEKVSDLSSMYTIGQTIEAVITRFDSETRRVNLSVKRLTTDPFEEIASKYPIDSKLTATVTKLDDMGVSLDLGNGVFGLIRKEKIPPTTTYAVGQEITASVSEIDKKRHKIVLVPVLREKPIGYR